MTYLKKLEVHTQVNNLMMLLSMRGDCSNRPMWYSIWQPFAWEKQDSSQNYLKCLLPLNFISCNYQAHSVFT